MFFHKTPLAVKWLYPGLEWKRPAFAKKIYLTFDDGPIPELTEFILETLDQYNTRATFFCVGDNLRKNPKIAEMTLAKGHQLGNHTFNHLNGWKTETIDYLANVEKCQNELNNLGSGSGLFRPPYGKIKRNQIKHLKTNYRIIMWDVLSGDFVENIGAERCLKNTINATVSGSVVIFHDNLKAEKNLKYVLSRYLDHFLSQGFEFDLV